MGFNQLENVVFSDKIDKRVLRFLSFEIQINYCIESIIDAAHVYQEINLPTSQKKQANCKADGDSVTPMDDHSAIGCPIFTFPGGIVQHNVRIKQMIEVINIMYRLA